MSGDCALVGCNLFVKDRVYRHHDDKEKHIWQRKHAKNWKASAKRIKLK